MLVKGLDGKEYNWKPEAYQSKRENASSLHKTARALIHELFPFYSINEELLLVGTPMKLYIDLYVHNLRAAFEVHGNQHYEHTSFFHASALDFSRAKRRDAIKREWCQLNNIDLVELPYNESREQWTDRIRRRGV